MRSCARGFACCGEPCQDPKPTRTAVPVPTVILRHADRVTAPQALLIYERLRRERTADVQRMSRFNGALYEAERGDLRARDAQLAVVPQTRSWIWSYDAEAEALAAAQAV